MKGGTTQPTQSEDLWAQAAVGHPRPAHSGGLAERWSMQPEDGVNAGSARGNGWVGLNLGGHAEGSAPNCQVPVA